MRHAAVVFAIAAVAVSGFGRAGLAPIGVLEYSRDGFRPTGVSFTAGC